MSVADAIKGSRTRVYEALWKVSPKIYRDAIASAEAVTITHSLRPRAAADVEAAIVLSVANALGIRP